MALGNTANTNPAGLNQQVGGFATALRNLMFDINKFATWFNKQQPTDIQTLFGLNATDATSMTNLVNDMFTLSKIYYGQVQQGGTGGTGATTFNFDDAFSVLWGGQ